MTSWLDQEPWRAPGAMSYAWDTLLNAEQHIYVCIYIFTCLYTTITKSAGWWYCYAHCGQPGPKLGNFCLLLTIYFSWTAWAAGHNSKGEGFCASHVCGVSQMFKLHRSLDSKPLLVLDCNCQEDEMAKKGYARNTYDRKYAFPVDANLSQPESDRDQKPF